MRKLIAICVIGSVAVGLLVAGCGGGGDSADAEQIDKATFVKQANKICEQSSGKLAADLASISNKESAKPDSDFTATQIAMVEKGLIPRLEEEQQKILALGIPEEAQKEAEAFLAMYQEAIEGTKAKSRAVATRGATPYEAIALAGTRLGISECPIAPVNAS